MRRPLWGAGKSGGADAARRRACASGSVPSWCVCAPRQKVRIATMLDCDTSPACIACGGQQWLSLIGLAVKLAPTHTDCTKDKDGGLPRTVRVRVKEISRAWTAADEARSIAWRALHVGEWSAVSDQWRAMFALSCRLATGILLSTGSRELSPPCIIRILDEALMMGGPHHAGASHELIELVNGADSARSIGSTPVTFDLHEIPPPPLPHGLACQPQDVPRLKQPSLATFFEACMRAEYVSEVPQ